MRAQSPTDVKFMLGRDLGGQQEPVDTAQMPHQIVRGIDEQRAARLLLLKPEMELGYLAPSLATYKPSLTPDPPLFVGSAIQMASEFYDNVPAEARSEMLWDVVSLSYAVGGPTPRVDVVDGMTTVDFSAPGHLVSILIDQDVCHLSAFSRQKELKMTYVMEKGVPRDEFVDVVWGQLRDFHRSSEA
ncbi:hypothetical protein ATY76_05990 [Rhizobium sp. R339]|nr:hypothetical protein ATY76_05990 [Rhizobium sp. R339]